MDFEIEDNDDNSRHVIYVTGDDSSDGKIEWSQEATKDLLKLYDEKMDLLESGIITTRKKMWELIGKEMNDKKYDYTGFQCENKWKSLKRAYNHRLRNSHKVFKRALPFEKEVAEILSKHDQFDPVETNFSSPFGKKDVDTKFFSINLNEPPGPNDESDSEDRLDNSSNLLNAIVDLKNEFKSHTQKNKRNIRLQEKSVEVQDKICKYLEVLQERVDQNVDHLQLQHKAIDMQKKMCKLLTTVQERIELSNKIEEKSISQQNEMIQQMKLQNMLLNKLLENKLQKT